MLDTSRIDECSNYSNMYRTHLEVGYMLWNEGQKELAGEYMLAMLHYILSGDDDFTTDNPTIRLLLTQSRYSVEKTSKQRQISEKWTETAQIVADMHNQGATQQEIANKLGLTQSRISKYLDEIRVRRPDLLNSSVYKNITNINSNNKNESTYKRNEGSSYHSISAPISYMNNNKNDEGFYDEEIPF